MSALLRTLEAFPTGRTTEEILVLSGAAFNHEKRIALLAELDELARTGKAVRGRDGKWRRTRSYFAKDDAARLSGSHTGSSAEAEVLSAAPARFSTEDMGDDAMSEESGGRFDPRALLRYWRSALRSDPRGATTGLSDRHGVDWHLVSGAGPIVPDENRMVRISIELDHLNGEFREALLRRESIDNALAVGWPLAVGRRAGVPVVWPVGLLSANWQRTSTHLEISIEADDVLVNEDWLRGAARTSSWSKAALSDIFASGDTVGQPAEEFLMKLREAVNTQLRGKVSGEGLAAQVDLSAHGVYDAAALFLPGESSFTAGASRDLDALAAWPEERLARTALAPVVGLEPDVESKNIAAVNLGALNGEQLRAVRNATQAPLSVVTGPPGTGKSQAIVSMAASVLLEGGTVMVASKNHQALDAVEDRLGGIASDVPFLLRTLDPKREIDVSFADVLQELISADSSPVNSAYDSYDVEQIRALAFERAGALDALEEKARLECDIAELVEHVERREHYASERGTAAKEKSKREERSAKFWARVWLAICGLFQGGARPEEAKSVEVKPPSEMSLPELRAKLVELRGRSKSLVLDADAIALADQIQELVLKVLPSALKRRVRLSEEERLALTEAKDDYEFQGKGPLPSSIARMLLEHRPLWLVSVLGTPKRVPLDDGLFDLVIFDEASQCDIASAMPLFARAKRAVVVGDDRQLSFIPQLGRAQDRNLMQAQGLPVNNMGRFAQSRLSLFDFALRVPHVPRVTLRHQYRSAGPIVDYISNTFYGGELVVAQPPEGVKVPQNTKPGIAWTHVAAPAIPSKGNINKAEAQAVAVEVRKLLVDQGYSGSIGAITPFRAQIMVIEEAVRAQVPDALLDKAEFRAGTVDGFQGQERDLILFSPVVGASSPTSNLTFLQKDRRRLNVAISRARAVAHILGDLDFARSGKVSALARLASIATEPRKRSGEGTFDSEWERRVYHALKDRGLEPFPQHEIAGRYLDFALFGKNGVKLDLEVDGRRWHQTADGRRKASDIWRDEQLKALGWRVRRFWVDELSQNMEACLDLVEQDLS
jgi:very-short-patch-repair endonuclease